MFPYRKIRIGLFGGSFNPTHIAHMELSKYAIKTLKLNLLIYIPAFKSVDKPEGEYLDSQDRMNILNLSRSKSKTIISNFEINAKREIQSIETVRYFRNFFRETDLFFLIGDDHLPTLHTWENWRELFDLSVIVVFSRLDKTPAISLPPELLNSLCFLKNKKYYHSSSSFREKKNFKLLHKKAAEYIKSKNLLI